MERPALSSSTFHKTRTVNHRTTQPIHLGNKQSGGAASEHRFEGRKCSRPSLQGLRANALVAVLPHDHEALAFGVSGESRALGFKSEARECLFRSRHTQICDDRPRRSLSAGTTPAAAYRLLGCRNAHDLRRTGRQRSSPGSSPPPPEAGRSQGVAQRVHRARSPRAGAWNPSRLAGRVDLLSRRPLIGICHRPHYSAVSVGALPN